MTAGWVRGAMALLCLGFAGCSSSSPAVSGESVQAAQSLSIVPLVIRTADGRTHRYRVEVARTPAEQATGLMYRHALKPAHGMIFPMQPPRPASFWMANTWIELDIIFIAPDGRVESVVARAQPESRTAISSRGAVSAVLELAGGEAARIGLASGDKVHW